MVGVPQQGVHRIAFQAVEAGAGDDVLLPVLEARCEHIEAGLFAAHVGGKAVSPSFSASAIVSAIDLAVRVLSSPISPIRSSPAIGTSQGRPCVLVRSRREGGRGPRRLQRLRGPEFAPRMLWRGRSLAGHSYLSYGPYRTRCFKPCPTAESTIASGVMALSFTSAEPSNE